jgi:hypothetical protein
MAAEAARVSLSGGRRRGAARDRLDAVGRLPFRNFGNWVDPATLGNRRHRDTGAGTERRPSARRRNEHG